MPIHPDTIAVITDTNPSQAPQFYLALGRAITSWQIVESEICGVFVKVSTCRDEQVASAIFYSPQDFSEKLKLVLCSARLSLDTPELDEWEKLHKRLIKASELRNELAHFHAVIEIPGGTPGPTVEMAILQLSTAGTEIGDRAQVAPHPPGVRWVLRPNIANPNLKLKDTNKRMVTADILKAGNSFQSLIQDVKKFSATMSTSLP
jgi:hypothetical protein